MRKIREVDVNIVEPLLKVEQKLADLFFEFEKLIWRYNYGKDSYI